MPRFVDLVNPDLMLIIPQLIVLGTAIILLLADILLSRTQRGVLTWITLVGLAAAFIANFFYINANESTFNGAFRADDISVFVNLVVLLAGLLTVHISASYLQRVEDPQAMPLAEYYVLLLFSILGAMLVGAAGDLIVVFIGIEMTAIASYTLTGFARHRVTSLEGALKYFLLGLFASAILLYGMAWVYGATGSTTLEGIAAGLQGVTDGGVETSLLLAILLLVIGLAFKVAAVPFHMWTPDAYEGAPTPVTAYLSVIPKVAGFAAMIRILVQALEPVRDEWVLLVAVLAVVTMAFGNIVAITQRSVKRMLAYSSIGHTGYILAGFAAFTVTQQTSDELAISSVLYYLLAYAFMNIGAFAIVTWLQHRGRGPNVEDFNGLASQSPLAAVAMTIFMLSLMGLPPLVGFYAKYYVILAAIEADMLWLGIAIVLASAASAFYYLRVVVAMYFAEPAAEAPEGRSQMLGFGVAVMVVGTIFAGIFSGQLLELAQNWVRAFTVVS